MERCVPHPRFANFGAGRRVVEWNDIHTGKPPMPSARTLLTTLLAVAVASAGYSPAAAAAAADHAPIDPKADYIEPWAQIENLAWPLMVAAADQCKEPSWRTGFDLSAIPEEGLIVRGVAPGSPADGKLRQYDRVLAYNGHELQGNSGFIRWYQSLRNEAAESDRVQRWTVERDGQQMTVEIQPVQVCYVEIQYNPVTTRSFVRREGVLSFNPNLYDLAPEPWMIQAQIAHDLGHRLGQHEAANKRRNNLLGIAGRVTEAVGGFNIAGAGTALNLRKRPEQEVDADRNGIDLAVRIGLPEADVIQYWVEVIDQQAGAGGGATWLSGHPAHPTRIEALQQRFENIGKPDPATASAPADEDQSDS